MRRLRSRAATQAPCRAAVIALLLGLSVSIAAAAETGAESPLDTAPGAQPRDEPVEEIVVYGVRTGQLGAIPSATTSTLFADDFRAENMDLAELLAQTEGISVRRFGGPGDSAELSIRGSSPSQVVVTIDGVRANSALTGGLDLSRVCLPLVDRVDIMRGAGGSEEGSGAVGGVVNIVTRGADAGPTLRGRVSGGSFETWEGSLLLADGLPVGASRLDYSVGYCGFVTAGDFEFEKATEIVDGIPAPFVPDSATRINNEREQHGGSLALGLPVGPGMLRFSDYAVYSSGGEPGVDSNNGRDAGQAARSHARDLSNLAQLRWESPSFLRRRPPLRSAQPETNASAGEHRFDATLYHRFERAAFRNPIPGGVFAEPIDTDVRLSTLGARLHERWQDRLLGQSSDLQIRLDYSGDVLISPDQENRDRERLAGALTETLGFFEDRLKASAGLRLDWTQGFSAQLLPEFGLVIEPAAWLRLRGHAARSYRAPNFEELFHPDDGFLRGNRMLRPEDAWNFDAGIEFAFASLGPVSDVELRASWFRREVDESILWVLIDRQTVAPVNTGSATSEGYEIAAGLSLSRYVRISANHTQTDSRRDANGARLPGQSSEETSGRLRVGPEAVWKLVGEVQRVGEILVNLGGTRKLPARTVWNASAAIDLAALSFLPLSGRVSELWLFGEVNNIGDVAIRDSVSFPQPGRHVNFGLEVAW